MTGSRSGGTLIAIGTLYLWLQAFPLRNGEEWAWWTLLLSGVIGFLSFLAYLIYGYLDSWHAVASAALLPLFVAGIRKTQSLLPVPRQTWSGLARPAMPFALTTRLGVGRACMLCVGGGMALAGSVIIVLGSTVIFVPQDLTYLGYTAERLNAINPHLLPLIAHDRAGFGGGLASCGLIILMIVWKTYPSRALWQALLVSGLAGFGCAIGVHYSMDYLIASHLAPAWVGAALYAAGMGCLYPASMARSPRTNPAGTSSETILLP